MRIDIITLFPEVIQNGINYSILGRAIERGFVTVTPWNPRDYATDVHRTVDDSPYGGGAGMVLKPDVMVACIDAVKKKNSGPVIYMTPQGKSFSQTLATSWASSAGFVLLCGHYEGLDQRVRDGWVDLEVSIGDYVLTGGELPALVVVDAVCRLLPGVLGHEQSAREDSFSCGYLEHPHYTRPYDFCGRTVPDVLLSGNHGKIRDWRLEESIRKTMAVRPDLLRQVQERTDKELEIIRRIEREEGR